MTEELLIQFRDIAYTNAKAKGFFKDNQDDSAYIAAIHEELSEAFCDWNKHHGWISHEPKPCGIYFELTDAVIRVLSYSGYKGLSLHETDVETDRPYLQSDLCDVIVKCHLDIGQYYDLFNKESRDEFEEELQIICMQNLLSAFIHRIEEFIAESSEEEYSLEQLILQKLAYNLTRENKHGGNEV